MPRRLASALLLSALLAVPFPSEAQTDTAETRIQALLEWSAENKRGLSIYLDGETIHGVVKEVLADAVVLSNQERATIVIRRERIHAVAGQ